MPLTPVDDTLNAQRSVRISIDLAALRRNMAIARRLSGGGRLFATVKADAYGHGAVRVAQALSAAPDSKPAQDGSIDHGSGRSPDLQAAVADGFAVVTLAEAMALREAGIRQPILILQGPRNAAELGSMQLHGLWPVIHDHAQYAWFCKHGSRDQCQAWLKVDTGMGRLGFSPEQAERLLDAADGVQWAGVLTHFACADETDNAFTHEQIRRFTQVKSGSAVQRSLANSAGVLAWPDSRADWARPGIMLYGCNPLDRALADDVALTPVMTVEAPLISVKQMSRGSGIGYAQSWRCPQDMPVGYVAAGYRDGMPRGLDATATIAIDGIRCPIIGRVSMDSLAVDLRPRPHTTVGQVAELWGKYNPLEELARAAGTIGYELLTGIRGQRHYIDD